MQLTASSQEQQEPTRPTLLEYKCTPEYSMTPECTVTTALTPPEPFSSAFRSNSSGDVNGRREEEKPRLKSILKVKQEVP